MAINPSHFFSDKHILWWLAGLWGGVIIVLSLMPGGQGQMLLFGIPHFDKVAHFGMYGVWTFLIFLAFRAHSERMARNAMLLAVLIGALFGIGLEFGQLFMNQGRSFELADMIANAIGAVAGVGVAVLFLNRKGKN